MEFGEAVVTGEPLESIRKHLIETVGPEGAGQAIATVAAFSGLVRVADGTGIPIDDGLATASGDIRTSLGLSSFGGAANSPHAPDIGAEMESVDALWSTAD